MLRWRPPVRARQHSGTRRLDRFLQIVVASALLVAGLALALVLANQSVGTKIVHVVITTVPATEGQAHPHRSSLPNGSGGTNSPSMLPAGADRSFRRLEA